jgi:hypothetical protein
MIPLNIINFIKYFIKNRFFTQNNEPYTTSQHSIKFTKNRFEICTFMEFKKICIKAYS